MTERIPRENRPGVAASKLVDDLLQPLAAANNYIGAARILISSQDPVGQRAVDFLEKAEAQILRAGEIARHVRRAAGIGDTSH